MSDNFTRDAIPEWALDAQNPAVIDAIAAATPFGAPSIPAAPDYDSIALSIDAIEGTGNEVDVIIDTTSARATQHHVDFGDGTDTLLGFGEDSVSHTYPDGDPVTVTVTNNAGQTDTIAADPVT